MFTTTTLLVALQFVPATAARLVAGSLPLVWNANLEAFSPGVSIQDERAATPVFTDIPDVVEFQAESSSPEWLVWEQSGYHATANGFATAAYDWLDPAVLDPWS